MIKSDAAIMQSMFQPDEVEISAERRVALARKGQALYGKYCGLHGKGICAESFAEYHAWRGEYCVVRDFLDFLYSHAEMLKAVADIERHEITEQLIQRLEMLLGEKQTI
jgi:hypothetical protein